MKDQETVSIGAVSTATGLAVTAIRYYDEIGLINVAHRESGQRRFTPSVIGQINFIKAAQKFGFSLEEISEIIEGEPGNWLELLDHKIEEMEKKQSQIALMLTMLQEIKKCGCAVIAECPRMEE